MINIHRLPLALLLTLATMSAAHAESSPVRSLIERRHENVVLQQWDLSCGAAALATLLRYQHGDAVDERQIATAMLGREEYVEDPSLVQMREGFSLLDLKRYAESRGYHGLGFGKLSLDDLIEKAPVLVPINLLGYNHFVIFRGVLADRVLLADPAWGNRTLSVDKFVGAWLAYPDIGHVGFIVTHSGDEPAPANALAPRAEEFASLH